MNATSPSNPDLPNFFHDFEQNAIKFAFRISAVGHTIEDAILKAVDLVGASGPVPSTGPAPAVEDAEDRDQEVGNPPESFDKIDSPAGFSPAEKDFFDNYRPGDEFLTPEEMHDLTRPGFETSKPKPRNPRNRARTKSRWSIFKWLSTLWIP